MEKSIRRIIFFIVKTVLLNCVKHLKQDKVCELSKDAEQDDWADSLSYLNKKKKTCCFLYTETEYMNLH